MTASEELSYHTVSLVLGSWEQLRRIPDYDQISGELLFRNLFEELPETKQLFGLQSMSEEDMFKSPRFKMHAKALMQIFAQEAAFDMIGPDSDFLVDILEKLGKRHAMFGVKPEYFLPVGGALLKAMKTMLGDSFTEEIRDAWLELYTKLCAPMITSIKANSNIMDTEKTRFQGVVSGEVQYFL